MNNVRFKQRAQLLVVGVITLAVSLVFTACPNVAVGGSSTLPPSVPYVQVAYGDLEAYLQNTASSGQVNRIEVTGLQASHLNGTASEASPLGKKLHAAGTKKVALKLPASLTGLTDMSYCFKDCAALVSVTAIPHGVTNLTGAFSGCSALSETPPLPVSVTVLKESFKDCTALTAANAIPATVTDMTECFKGCTALLRSPVIPKSIQNMNNCFAGCSTLRSVILKCEYDADRLTGAFTGCTSLGEKSIRVPKDQLDGYKSKAAEMGTEENRFTDGLVQVAYEQLEAYLRDTASSEEVNLIEVTGLQPEHLRGTYSKPSPLAQKLKAHPTKKLELKLPENIPDLSDMRCCFIGCTNMLSVTPIPQSVTNMGACFKGCTGLTEAPVLPPRVTNMNDCFSGCTGLSRAPTIPPTVTVMEYCFENCTGLSQAPEIPNGVTKMFRCFSGCTSLSQAPTIPPSVTDITACFENCTTLRQAPVIPASVEIMNSCFKNCSTLGKGPDIPASVIEMKNCFENCTALRQAPVIPASVESMNSCFKNCTALTGIKLLCNYRNSFADAFRGCTALGNGSIKVLQDQLSVYKEYASAMGTDSTKFDNVFTVVAYGDLEAYLQNTASSSMVNYIEITGEIPVADFKGDGFNPGTLGQKLKAHPDKKVALKIATYPAGLTSMEDCFADCKSLTTAPAIPESVTDMRYCFWGCTSLTTAPAIPESVIGMRSCFSRCTSLTTAPAIPESITDMHGCFANCKSLTTAPAIPAGVTDMSFCFENCTNLTTAPTIPAGVDRMYSCFKDCTKLTGVTLKCNYIALSGPNRPFEDAFKGCTALADGGIKVPQSQLSAYRVGAETMGTTREKFAAITP